MLCAWTRVFILIHQCFTPCSARGERDIHPPWTKVFIPLKTIVIFNWNFTTVHQFPLWLICSYNKSYLWLLCMLQRLILKLFQILADQWFCFFDFLLVSAFSFKGKLPLTKENEKWRQLFIFSEICKTRVL